MTVIFVLLVGIVSMVIAEPIVSRVYKDSKKKEKEYEEMTPEEYAEYIDTIR